jgi:hypothetical protein
MTEENILRALRMQAWARAKGELEAVAATFFGPDSSSEDQFDRFDSERERFITYIEDNGLEE